MKSRLAPAESRLYITVASILATLVPQGKELAFYYHNYSRALAWSIVTTRFHHFFRYVLFFIGVEGKKENPGTFDIETATLRKRNTLCVSFEASLRGYLPSCRILISI